MKKILKLSLAIVSAFAVLLSSLAITAFSESTSVNKMMSFGDSVLAGMRQFYQSSGDAYGDQKAVDLLAQEFGLQRFTDLSKITSEDDKWFVNRAVSGYYTSQILSRVKETDASLLAQCDVIYLDGGINDASGVFGKEYLNWAQGYTSMDAAKNDLERCSSMMQRTAGIIQDNFTEIINYLAGLDGFDGKIIIQNNLNPYGGSSNDIEEYIWDQVIANTVTKGQVAAIEATKDNYSKVYHIDINSKLRNGALYTGHSYSDALHLTFPGNRAIYKELSLLLNPNGENLIEFESTEIPEKATWRTLYDFEQYEVGETNIAGLLSGEATVVSIDEIKDSDGNLKEGYIEGSKKIIRCNTSNHAKFDFSALIGKVYGIRFNLIRGEDSTANNPMYFLPYATSKNTQLRANIYSSIDNWTQNSYSVDTTVFPTWYSTSLNISDLLTIENITLGSGNPGTSYYIDDIAVLTTEETLPEITTSETTKKTDPSGSSEKPTDPIVTRPTYSEGDYQFVPVFNSGNDGYTIGTGYPVNTPTVDSSSFKTPVWKFTTTSYGTPCMSFSRSDLGELAKGAIGIRLFIAGDTVAASNNYPITFALKSNNIPADASANTFGYSPLAENEHGQLWTVSEDGSYVDYIWSGKSVHEAIGNVYNSQWVRPSSKSVNADDTLSEEFMSGLESICIGSTKGTGTVKPTFYIGDIQFIKPKVAETTDLSVKMQMTKGASIRLNEQNGIRFTSVIDDADKIAQLKELGAVVEMGTLIMPKDLLGDEELVLETNINGVTPVNVKYSAERYYQGVAGQIAGSLVEIKESNTAFNRESGNITRDFVGRGYVKVTLNGETKVSYASYFDNDIANNTRSLAFIAASFMKDTENYNNISDDRKVLVENWAKWNVD